MNLPRKVLVIEDELDISRILKDYITISGYEVWVAENGQDGLKFIDTLSPDFIILDIMLPDVDGIELCRQIRETCNTPILILSARGSDTDKVLGLGFGADDYMTKPFSLSELVARINAHLRRGSMENKPKQNESLQFGSLLIDKKAYKVTVEGQEISLSAKEFELLYYLSKHKNQVFSKSQLLDAVWGYDTFGDESTITVYIRRLREKLEPDPSNPTYIKTVWGVGYKFSSD
ncbi:response regulator transcription factor [Paenibacillus sp. MER TA 81-3]|uniref:response regulator transcription factor n=1 Tax=Paenibacillus sp. MER TA 81-3 TaxID=2939573 RepID=UPI00203E45C2|nr:response regulator transcription factor [Paenibacillus sp. MER TA 81-3]MCM3342692.1 response regulator transcription factor [Paenibacillus sp. MER TA 81-3]